MSAALQHPIKGPRKMEQTHLLSRTKNQACSFVRTSFFGYCKNAEIDFHEIRLQLERVDLRTLATKRFLNKQWQVGISKKEISQSNKKPVRWRCFHLSPMSPRSPPVGKKVKALKGRWIFFCWKIKEQRNFFIRPLTGYSNFGPKVLGSSPSKEETSQNQTKLPSR